jgi:hypothetical protein
LSSLYQAASGGSGVISYDVLLSTQKFLGLSLFAFYKDFPADRRTHANSNL